jgi:histidine triad (HIT) family protein
MSNDDCIFCKIIGGELPSKKIYENEKVLAFLDINPASKGHALVVPKMHFESIYDISEEYLKEVYSAAKKIAISAKENLKTDGCNITQNNGKTAGQTINHFHVHVLPRYNKDSVGEFPAAKYKEDNFDAVAYKLRKGLQ